MSTKSRSRKKKTTEETTAKTSTKQEPVSDIDSLPLSQSTINKLKEAGYTSVYMIAMESVVELATKLGVSQSKALEILKAAWNASGFRWVKASEIVKTRRGVYKITTGSKALDALLGGGVETKTITEFYGEFGTGKTQLCHQLAVNVQLPLDKGGLEKGAAYMDCEGTFRWERIKQMAEAKGLNPDKVMDNILYIRVASSDHQMAVVDDLYKMIPEYNIGLVIIDSVTGHFRAEYPGRENLAVRQQKLNRHLRQLMKLAETYNVAVVVTNQVMARPDVFYGDPTQPVGGHVLYHVPGVRVYLRKSRGGKRIARIVDAPHLPEGEAIFKITDKGIEDAE